MSLATYEDATTKFWRMPELVEKLLEYLDEVSILSIVGVKLLTVEVLQAALGTSMRSAPKPLGKLFRKALGFGQPQTFVVQRTKVERISRTLLAQLESPRPLLLELLDVICAEHKYVKGPWQESVIRMSCPLHTYHSVSAKGFILLEDCESAIGSTEQRIRKIELAGCIEQSLISRIRDGYIRDTLLSSLVSRVTRQLVAVETLTWHATWHSNTLEVNSKEEAVTLNALLQRCDQLLNVQTVKVCGELEMEGWEALAKALQKHPCHAKAIFSSKKRMLEAKREDLRIIWDAMPGRPNGLRSSWAVEGKDMEGHDTVEKRFNKTSAGLKAEEKSERAWMELVEFLDEPEPEEEARRRLRSGRELSLDEETSLLASL